MNPVLTEEQTLIEESALDLLGREYDFALRRESLAAPHGCRPNIWGLFADAGWLALPVPEARGGLGCGALEAGLLMRAFGRHLVVEPFHACALTATRLLADLARADQGAAWLPGLIDGTRRIALAHDELPRSGPWEPRATRATRRDGAWILDGAKLLSRGAPGSDALLVSARVEGAGQRVFLLPRATPGLAVHDTVCADGTHAADLTLAGVRAGDDALLGDDADATPALERALAWSLVALCWEACGAMSAACEMTAAYMRERRQFGQALANFQVVQHRVAEMTVACEDARASCELAALRLDAGAADVTALASMAKAKVGREARFVSQNAVQLHGAMGVTEELAIASLFRKLTMFQQQCGATAWHARTFGAARLGDGAWRGSATLPAAMAA